MACQVFAVNRSTFVNIQTSTGIIYYPNITAVSKTEIMLATGTVVKIEDVNSVMAYGESKSIVPLLWGAGCSYLGIFPGFCVGIMLFPEFFAGNESHNTGMLVSVLAGAVLSGSYAYRRSVNRNSERSQIMVFMGGWTLEQKRDFFISALKP